MTGMSSFLERSKIICQNLNLLQTTITICTSFIGGKSNNNMCVSNMLSLWQKEIKTTLTLYIMHECILVISKQLIISVTTSKRYKCYKLSKGSNT